MNRNLLAALGVVVALALFGGGAAVGRALAPAPATDAAATDGGAAGAQGARRANVQGQGGQGAFAQGGVVSGRVLSVQDGSITVEVRQQGAAGASPALSSTIALVGQGTRVVRSTETQIPLADVKAGDTVTIVGSADAATGTVSATAVLVGGNALQQLVGPGGRQGQGGGGPAQRSASPSPGR